MIHNKNRKDTLSLAGTDPAEGKKGKEKADFLSNRIVEMEAKVCRVPAKAQNVEEIQEQRRERGCGCFLISSKFSRALAIIKQLH